MTSVRIFSYPGFDIDKFRERNPHLTIGRGGGDTYFDIARPPGRQPNLRKCARCGFEAIITHREAYLKGWLLKRRSACCPRCAGRKP